ncbi:MAG: hypothetical protein PHE83_15780 [Opitutaceae bacterium]|nr:hypothetical protein [Opitutaceae bacterium]
MIPTMWSATLPRRLGMLLGTPLMIRGIVLGFLFGALGLGWQEYLGLSDGGSFLTLARTMLNRSSLVPLTFYDTRVFPFWPLGEALVLTTGLPEPAVLGLTVLLSGLVVWLFHRLTGSLPFALLLAVFPPAWVLASVHPVSEALYLALGLAAAWALRLNRFCVAGLCMGAMISTRPFGIAWAAMAVVLGANESRLRRSWRQVALTISGIFVGLSPLILINLHFYGDVWHQVRVYAAPLNALNVHGAVSQTLGPAQGHWGPPFWYVLATPWIVPVPFWKVAYIYAHVVALLLLIPVALSGMREEFNGRRDLARILLFGAFVLNGILIVCGGPYWGFHSFDRYFLWGLPGALLSAERILHGRLLPWLPLAGVVSLAAVGFSLVQHLP